MTEAEISFVEEFFGKIVIPAQKCVALRRQHILGQHSPYATEVESVIMSLKFEALNNTGAFRLSYLFVGNRLTATFATGVCKSPVEGCLLNIRSLLKSEYNTELLSGNPISRLYFGILNLLTIVRPSKYGPFRE